MFISDNPAVRDGPAAEQITEWRILWRMVGVLIWDLCYFCWLGCI